MRIPKGFSVLIYADNSVHITLNNYSGDFLAFQIIVLGIPLLIASFLLGLSINPFFLLTFPLLILLAYWCVYNYKDRTKFIFTKDSFIVIEGMHKYEKLNVKIKDIKDTKKVTISGGSYSSPENIQTVVNHPNYELYIITHEGQQLITKHVGPNGQTYLDKCIRLKMEEYRNNTFKN